MKFLILILIVLNWTNLALAKSIKLGGSDTGGGTGLRANGSLVLKDFAHCNLALSNDKKIEPLNLIEEKISDSISSLDSNQISAIIFKNAHFQDPLFKAILETAVSRANFYSVEASIENNDKSIERLAVFKRPLGIIIDKNLFSRLSSTHQVGLLFHESLRMVSIGFGIPLLENEIEDLTCQAFSGSLKIENFKGLNDFLNQWKSRENLTTSLILDEINNAKDLNDISFPLFNDSTQSFLYQKMTSKFENLRDIIPSSLHENLDDAFYNWATKEAPKNCSGASDCHFYEVWPLTPGKLFSSFVKWTLVENNFNFTAWINESNQVVFINKSLQNTVFCQDMVHANSLNFKLESTANVEGIEYLIDRINLDYFSFVYPENAKQDFCTFQVVL